MLTSIARLRVVLTTVTLAVSIFLMQSLWWTDSTGTRRYVLFDDAMISLSYGRTFLRGDGLVWFSGAPRVQGYTNLGWTLLIAPFTLFDSALTTSIFVSLLGAMILVAIGLLVLELARDHAGSIRLATSLVVVLHFPLVYWTIRGMEVGLLTLIALAVVFFSSEFTRRSEVAVASLIAFGVFVRLDMTLVAIAMSVVSWHLDGHRITRRNSIPLCSGVASAVATVVVSKLYYGTWVPNTMQLKMSGGPLTERITAGVDSLIRHPYGLLFAIAAVSVASIDRRPLVLRLSSIAIVFNAYSLFVGGDSWEWFANRYFALATPLAAVAFILALDGHWRRHRSLVITIGAWISITQIRRLVPDRSIPEGVAVLAATLVLIAFLALIWRPQAATWAALTVLVLGSSGWIMDVARSRTFDHQADVDRVERALAVREVTDDGATIAVVSAGSQVYLADRPAVDLLGKSDPRIASLSRRVPFFPGHDKWDLNVSMSDPRPDVFLEEYGPEFRDAMLDGGYELLCSSRGVRLWVSSSSQHVNRLALKQC